MIYANDSNLKTANSGYVQVQVRQRKYAASIREGTADCMPKVNNIAWNLSKY